MISTVFPSGKTYGSGGTLANGINTTTWGPFDLSNLRPDKIFRTQDTIFQPPGAFLEITAVNAIPTVIADSPGSTTSLMLSAIKIRFASADLVDLQYKPWHDAIVACGGKPVPDVY
jgi:hypothetical protein